MNLTTPRIRILQCEDELALDRTLREETARVNPDPGIADLNIARLDGRGASQAEIATAINAMPFLAEYRLAILENTVPGGRDEGAREKFLRLLENSPETTRIILVLADEYKPSGAGSGWQTYKRDHWLRKWQDGQKEKAGWEELRLPELRGMPAWIQQEARQAGGRDHPAGGAGACECHRHGYAFGGLRDRKTADLHRSQAPGEPGGRAGAVRLGGPDQYL